MSSACVHDTRTGGKGLCGRLLGDKFAFLGANEWLHNALRGGNRVCCPDCLKIIRSAVVRDGGADA